jgi:hypothetical protein
MSLFADTYIQKFHSKADLLKKGWPISLATSDPKMKNVPIGLLKAEKSQNNTTGSWNYALQMAGQKPPLRKGIDLQILQWAPYQMYLVIMPPNFEQFFDIISKIKLYDSERSKQQAEDQAYERMKQKFSI